MLARAVQRESLAAFAVRADVAAAVFSLHFLRVYLGHSLLLEVAEVAVRLLALLVFAFTFLLLHVRGYEVWAVAKASPIRARHLHLLLTLRVPTTFKFP